MVGLTIDGQVLHWTTRDLRKAYEAHKVAVKHARQKSGKESGEKLVETSQNLSTEILDTDTVLRHADGTGLQTQALKELVKVAKNAIVKSDCEVALREQKKEAEKSKKGEKKKEKREETEGTKMKEQETQPIPKRMVTLEKGLRGASGGG